MSIYDIILSRRTIRRFQQTPIKIELLKKFVNAARVAPSAANLQPLQYCIVIDKILCDQLFEALNWAGYIQPPWRPAEHERPTAYIVVLVSDMNNEYYLRDVGLATENIVLAAEAEHIGTCIICNINRNKIQEILNIPHKFTVDSVIALGYKAETAVVEDMKESVHYWRDEHGVHHVPKRKLDEIIHINRF